MKILFACDIPDGAEPFSVFGYNTEDGWRTVSVHVVTALPARKSLDSKCPAVLAANRGWNWCLDALEGKDDD